MECRRREDLPARLHYGHNPRVAAIPCIAEPGWSIIAGEPQWPLAGGAPGSDNKDPEMLALFVASKAGLTGDAGLIDHTTVYPLMMPRIGFAQLANDETGVLLESPAK